MGIFSSSEKIKCSCFLIYVFFMFLQNPGFHLFVSPFFFENFICASHTSLSLSSFLLSWLQMIFHTISINPSIQDFYQQQESSIYTTKFCSFERLPNKGFFVGINLRKTRVAFIDKNNIKKIPSVLNISLDIYTLQYEHFFVLENFKIGMKNKDMGIFLSKF